MQSDAITASCWEDGQREEMGDLVGVQDECARLPGGETTGLGGD